MKLIKFMKPLLNILLLTFLAIAPLAAYSDYDSAGVRDPMVRTVWKKTKKTTKNNENTQIQISQQDIYNILKKCKIEGVVISNNKRLVLINDRLLAEGDKILPDYDVYIYKIDYKLIKFSLDGQIASYSLSISK